MQAINDHDNYSVIEGNLPILISAPHVYAHFRPTLRGVFKQGEPRTDYILKSICESTGSWGIFAAEDQDFDPNYFSESRSDYKKEIRKIIESNKIKLVIDLHGLSNMHQYDLGIYYLRKFPKSHKIAYSLADKLRQGALKDILIQVFNFTDDDQETIGEFATRELRVPSLQIEISQEIRADEAFCEKFIMELANYLSEFAM